MHPRLRSAALVEEFDTLETKVLATVERVKEESKVRRVEYPMKSEHGSRGGKIAWMKILKIALGVLLVVAFLTGMLLLNIFPLMPSSPAGWAILILAGVPAYLLVQMLGEYVMEKVNAKVEARRERKGINATGMRALVMLLVGLLVVVPLVYFGLVFVLSRF
jgi:hypothetical protein